MNQEKIVIDLKNGKSAILSIIPFDTDIDTDNLTTIQHHNIMGEILTSSNLLNRVGNLKVEQENIVAEAELDLKIWEAGKEKEVRKKLTYETEPDTKGKTKTVSPTINEVDAELKTLPEYKIMHTNLLKLKKDMNILNAFYWAVKSKDDKLVKLSEKLVPGDFESHLVEGRINDVYIKIQKNVIGEHPGKNN